MFYKKGWVEVGKDIFDQRLSETVAKDKWIIDGNFVRTMDVRFEKADTIIFLDYSRFQSLCGVFVRLIRDYGKVRKDMAEGCPESFDWEFLKYVYSFNKKHRPKILSTLKNIKTDCNVIVFKSRKQSEKWLENLS